MPKTTVNSFILRFVQEQSPANGAEITTWHGVIRHVQSKEEVRFARIEDALRFMADFVNINSEQVFGIEE